MAARIVLTQGKFALVDDEDYEVLAGYRWFAFFTDKWYAGRMVQGASGQRRILRMHVAIASAPRGVFMDHADGDGLNNTRANLRRCTAADNARNCRRKVGVAGYRGVRLGTSRSWSAQIRSGGRKRHLGTFASPAGAARAYDRAARELFGDFAVLNFPSNRVDDSTMDSEERVGRPLSKTGYRGVRKIQNSNCWVALIGKSCQKEYLGCFGTPEDAARAYDAAALKYHGEFAKLNFPQDVPAREELVLQ